MLQIVRFSSFIALFLLSSQLSALEIKGIEIPQSIQQKSASSTLQINGAGIRSKFVFSIYIGALYLNQKSSNPDEIINSNQARTVTMHFLYDKIEKEKLASGWSAGFEDNLSDEELSRLQAKIKQFNALFPDVVKGDLIQFNFLANGKTETIINSNPVAAIDGRDFQSALLKIWLGKEPVDEDLKSAMLGQE